MNNADKPVYPRILSVDNEAFGYKIKCDNGLTKREYFAAMAMQGLLANPAYNNPELKHKMVTVPNLALTALDYADALLSALSTSSNQVNK